MVHLAPAAGVEGAYLIRTLVSRISDSGNVSPLALYNVYATREDGRWVLANALPRNTSSWMREAIGRVTFVYPPSYPFDRARARATAVFADSLAQAFDLPPPEEIGYYFTANLLETYRALGLDFYPVAADTVGGRPHTANNLVYVGSSQSGEVYRHEVAHLVLVSLISANTAPLVSEGIMTWVGGSAGLSFSDLMPPLNAYLDANPDVTLQGILTSPPVRQGTLDVGYAGIAVLCKMVHDAGGVAAIRSLLDAGREADQVLDTAANLLSLPRSQLESPWQGSP